MSAGARTVSVGAGARGAATIIRAGTPTECRPWPRFVLGAEAWAALAAAPDGGDDGAALLALWAEPGVVHAAFQGPAGGVLLASCAAPDGRYAALSPAWPAAPFERMVRDLWSLSAVGGADARPFLDHGRWAVSAPLSAQPLPRSAPPVQPEFPPPPGAAGEGLHQIPLGPVRPVPLGAAHLRLHALGGTVAAMEAQGGYGHRGLVALMLGRSPRAAARVAARVAADGAVAHALAFARAAEAATGTAPPPRALALRALMGELERVANHLRWWGGVCAAAGLGWPEARCAVLREGVLRAAGAAFGHRLMLDRVVPGGVAADLGRDGPGALHDALAAVAAGLPELEDAGENRGGLRDRLEGRVVTAPALVARLGAGGPVGRAAGRGLDARRLPGGNDGWAAAPGFAVPVLAAGDAEARQRVLLAELRASVGLAQALLDGMPPGEVLAPWPQRGGEGVGVAEGPRGACLHWLALDDDGQIRAAFPFDPAWGHWPLLAAAMAGAPASELALGERSLLCSAAGVDL